MQTLRELKPNDLRTPVAVYGEYAGRRYLITHAPNWVTAEIVATDYAKHLGRACYYTTDRYDSTCINGRAKDLRKAIN